MRPTVFLWVLVIPAMVCAAEPPPSDADIEKLCTQLGSESFDARDQAHRMLIKLGRRAKERLQLLQKTSVDAEVVWRAAAILREVAERKRIEDIFGAEVEASHSEEQLAEAKSLARQLELGGVQHRHSVYEKLGPAKLPQMVSAMRAWLRKNPKDGHVAYNLGYTLFYMERNREAAAVWHYTETIAPHECRAFNDAAIALERDARYEEARAQYEKTIKRFPQFSHPVHNLATLKAAMGDHKGALAQFQANRHLRGLGDSGTNDEAILAEYLTNNGKLEEAEKHFKAAFAQQDKRIYAYGCRFDSLHTLGRFDEMRELTAQAAREFPGRTTTMLMQIVTASESGDRNKALAILNDLMAKRGETDSLRRRKARLLIGLERYKEAGTILKRLLEQNPRNPYTLSAAAYWARKTKRWREAVEYATARTQILPRVPYGHAQLAVIYATADDPKVKNIQRARDLARIVEKLMANSYYYGQTVSNRASLEAQLSYVYEMDGKSSEALARYRVYAQLYTWNKKAQDRLAKLTAAAEKQPELKPSAP